jgi:plastocyanin domain-containing protein
MRTKTIILGALALATAAFANPFQQENGQSCCGGAMAMQAGHDMGKPVAAKVVKGVQKATVTIDNGMYMPAVISVKKGKPVELTFKAGKKPGCGSTVVFKSLKISKEVGSKPVTIKFTPKDAGTIAFTCGMGMFDGKVVVK